jgi:signal peptidase II
MTSLSKYLFYLVISIVVIAVDQWTKAVAYENLLGAKPIDVLPVFQWALVFNRGAAFGFLANAGGLQHYFFSALAIIIGVVILVWLWRSHAKNTILSWGLTFVLGGAIGNLIDRLRFQYVIDFINLHYHDWYFPAFNVADMAITLGAFFLILDALGIGEKSTNV